MARGDRRRARPRREPAPEPNPFGEASANGEATPIGETSANGGSESPPGDVDHLHRENVPGSLDHASGDVDEFDAALVRGAHGEAVPDDSPSVAADEEPEQWLSEEELVAAGAGESSEPATGSAGRGGRDRLSLSQRVEQAASPPPRAPRHGNRVIGFLRASWAELQRVQWPDRPQVFQATAVVMGFVAVAGLYLGVADFIAHKVVNAIL
jgi:preprotein translocase subunit SecE